MAPQHDHCRIGSLEMDANNYRPWCDDHCRIGSLEISTLEEEDTKRDHCRIGSLEKEDKL